MFIILRTILLHRALAPRGVLLDWAFHEGDLLILKLVEGCASLFLTHTCVGILQVLHVGVHVEDELSVGIIFIIKGLIIHEHDHIQLILPVHMEHDALVGRLDRVDLHGGVDDCLGGSVEEEEHVYGKQRQQRIHNDGCDGAEECGMAVLAVLVDVQGAGELVEVFDTLQEANLANICLSA